MDRREFLAGMGAAAVLVGETPSAFGGPADGRRQFPDGFLWGASTSGHQIEGQNVASDLWYLENLPETKFAEPSGDSANSFNQWSMDLDLVRDIGLDTYRFSVEWSRIEPVEGRFSRAMVDHYRAIVLGCRERGIKPIVTFNHFTAPLWFSADGGWTNPSSPQRFARYCRYVAEALAADIEYAVTINEPQILPLLNRLGLPPVFWEQTAKMLEATEKRLQIKRFSSLNVSRIDDFGPMQANLLNGHRAGRDAIKSVRDDLPVGVSIAIFDDQEAEPGSIRDQVRQELYGDWLEVAREDDFLGVQNYERKVWGRSGEIAPSEDSRLRNYMGSEVYPPSLAGAVDYAHAETGVPILITEHGVGTKEDSVRQQFIEASLVRLHESMGEKSIPVIGYCHWSLLDNFEWVFGFGPQFGLVAVDRTDFTRTPKASAATLGKIARANGW